MSERNDNSFEVCSRGPYQFHRNLGGVIYVVCDGEPFPAEGWFDLPVLILGSWADEAIRLRRPRSRTAELLFMDGPFMVRVEKQLPHWRLAGVRRREGGGEQVLVEWVVSEQAVLAALHRAATDLVERCHREHWVTDDLIYLEQQLLVLAP